MKMFKYSIREKKQNQADQKLANKSARVMRTERGSQAQHIGARRIDGALTRTKKAQNRYCNNLDSNGKVKRVA